MKAIRGAITVPKNTKKAIYESSKKLLSTIIKDNKLKQEEIISIIFTATTDLDKAYPATAARELGIKLIPLLCFQEMYVVDSLKKCIRILLYVDRNCKHKDIKHVYLREAITLRPDLAD
ncbi:MAG TPA: chorismate mutase [Halanaerobiales bacterium]|nr:chorismate mutase [Halanaerobiales bacterium]